MSKLDKKYERSSKYDSQWISDNWMGPHPLWLVEELCKNMDLRPGMKLLDMGCGKGLTSVFLAKEYGVTVFANDLWVDATENLRRFEEAGVADRVFPIRAEAHVLPYANEFFDAAISIDSYHYYGTDESYFPGVYAKLVKPGGQFGIVIPGFTRDYENGYPDTLKSVWDNGMFTFHNSLWWRQLWEKTGIVQVQTCYDVPSPKEIWMPWAKWSKEKMDFCDEELINADTANDIALIAMTAVKKGDVKL